MDYASPEQLLGSPPRFACDIYSLGVLLYELLSGERPFQQTGNWFPGDITVRLDKCPAPPSKTIRKRGSPAGRSSQITSELDAITLKALSRDPTLRYQSPQEFAADLQRYLNDRPVMAREHSIMEHVLTFVRRRRGLMAVAVLLLLFVTGAVWERHMALMERRKAEERLRKSWQSAVLLMDDVDTRMAKLPNSWAARREMLSQAMTQLESLALDPQVSPSLKFDLARAYIKLGGIQDNGMWWGTGDFAAVARSYQRAARLLTEIEDEPQVARRDVLLTLSMVYRYITGAELFIGNFDHALESSSRAISALASLEQEKRRDSQVLTAMALALVSKGDVDQAMALSDPTLDWAKAGKVYAAAIEEGSHRSDGVYGLMRVQLRLSFYHCYTGDPAKGMDYARNVLRLGNELNRLKHPAAAWLNLAARERMGVCYAHLHHAAEAFVEFDKLVRGISRISEQNPEDVVPRQQLAWAYLKRAKALLTLKRVTDAQRDYAQVLALADTLPQLPQDTLRVPLWAMTYSGLSTIERQTAFSGATTRHHKSECAYLSRALTLFAEMQKRHGMDLDEREEMRFVANRATACGLK